MTRPSPPPAMLGLSGPDFVPAPDLAEWAMLTFVDEDSPLFNEDHAHLAFATIGFLWTRVVNVRAMCRVVGTCEPGARRGLGAWAKARAEMQLREWFGHVPDFLITLDGPFAASCGDAEFCAIVEHELLHCGQERDAFGAPKFSRGGRPVFCLRGHDIQEFHSIARRYGAVTQNMRDFKDALSRKPEIASVDISGACGTCHLRAA